MEKAARQASLSWVAVSLLAVLCGILAVLQYRWIGDVSRGERERLQHGLQESLYRLSEDFNSEINAACSALVPEAAQIERAGVEQAYGARYAQWKVSSSRDGLFRRISIAAPRGDVLVLRDLDLRTGVFGPADWPTAWNPLRKRLTARLLGGDPPGSPPGGFAVDTLDLIEMPRFGRPRATSGPPQLGAPEQEWLLLQLDLDYLRSVVLPELLQQHLGTGGKLDYAAEIVTRTSPQVAIYQSDSRSIGADADASVGLFEVFPRPPRGPGGERTKSAPASFADSGRGRWLLRIRHHAGSLEAVVSQTRRRNLAVSAAILLLVLATVAALTRFTQQSRKLAELQMDFVAGVSHELRTPLTVICTAAYNLRRKVANNPGQVEKYGALIQQEGEKLTAIVDQVLRFASAKAGQVIRKREPLDIEALIQDMLQSSNGVFEGARCVVERRIDAGLPLILGDPMALKHALLNLLHNASNYAKAGGNWIGVFATASRDRNGPVVEIRVVDRGPGIPLEEQAHIFDPFFRGKRAIENQIHGTGLGLNLVKRIIEAHGGTVGVRSEPMKGAEFVVRIPAAPEEQQDEFPHSPDRG